MSVAVLYVDPRGPYPRMEDVDCWDESRDARHYAGPHPVVAHPPCGPWGNLAHLCFKQDPKLAPLAVDQVRRWGGVLEHPAGSRLWQHKGLPLPGEAPDAFGGVTVEVRQVDYGHCAEKRTWLYIVGAGAFKPPKRARCRPTHWISGGRRQRKGGGVRPANILACSNQLRRRTPPEFAEFLVGIARSCRRRRRAA